MTEKKNAVMSLTEIWGLIWGHKWWYVASLAIGLLAAALYLYRTPDEYVRTVKLVVDECATSVSSRQVRCA